MNEQDIKPYTNNAKKHPASQLKKLADIVAEVGWRLPILVNSDGVIVVGHGRWEAYQLYKDSLGLKQIWAINTEGKTVLGEPETTKMTDEQERMYRIADNKVSELGSVDLAIVMRELTPLSDELQLISGYEAFELAEISDVLSDISDDLEDAYSEPENKQLQCPKCQHIDEASHFKRV